MHGELDKEALEAFEQVKDQMEELAMSHVDKSIIHDRCECDGCGMFPILGPRYKCSVCKNFDFCSKCEEFSDHEHAFLKINDPLEVPCAIITGILDQSIYEEPVSQPAKEDDKAQGDSNNQQKP